MSEFKFACPVCGQHITADTGASGSQLDCPTCFRKIVVPSVSSESKFVLSASEAKKTRSIPRETSLSATAKPKPKQSPLPIVIGIVAFVIGAVGAGLFLLNRNSKNQEQVSQPSTNAIALGESATKRRMPVGTNVWMLDLAAADFPAETAFGTVHGLDFVCDRAVLQGGTLNLRMGREWPPEVGVSIALFAREGQDLSGKSIIVNTNNIRSPKVVLRWKESGANQTETFTNDFALKMEFGPLKGNRMPGKIYLCTPDSSNSTVAGVFNAEVKKPSQPKQK